MKSKTQITWIDMKKIVQTFLKKNKIKKQDNNSITTSETNEIANKIETEMKWKENKTKKLQNKLN